MKRNRKLVIIGLDCATPKTILSDFLDNCPNIKKLVNNGVYGKLKSSDPPITIPAWMVMMTGKNAGTLGVYGFRHRKGNSYHEYWITNSYTIQEPKIWDIISNYGLKSCIIGVPPTYPIQELNGCLVSCFLTPNNTKDFTYPTELKNEINKLGEYIFDVVFRTDNKDQLLIDLYNMTNIQFKVAKYLMKNKDWDFFNFVIIGLDRFHHAFWKYYDKEHKKYKPGNKYELEMKKFYIYLDRKIGEILDILDNNAKILIVSDHGAKPMKGCLSVNMALENLGLLKFKNIPDSGTRLNHKDIDWKNSYAWGWGGYYSRIFLNVRGREKYGIIKKKNYEEMRNKISNMLMSIKDDKGNPMNTKIFKPEELFTITKGDKPDLMVYFDELNWRAAETVGYDTMYLSENDTGPDDAVHDYFGIYIFYDPKKKIGKNLGTKNIIDIAPTCLNLLNVKVPKDMEGQIIKF